MKFDHKNWKAYVLLPLAILYLVILTPYMVARLALGLLYVSSDFLLDRTELPSNFLWMRDLTKWRKKK